MAQQMEMFPKPTTTANERTKEQLVLQDLVKEMTTERAAGTNLSALETAELQAIIVGKQSKESAFDQGVACDTVRARRKKLYAKLEIGGADEIVLDLLARAVKKLVVAGR